MDKNENFTQDTHKRGFLVTVGDKPPVGDNTTIMLYMVTLAALKEHTPTAYFSPILSNVGVVNRLISIITGIDRRVIETGTLSDEQWKLLDQRLPHLLGEPLYVDDTPEVSVNELTEKIHGVVMKHGVRLVVIDPVNAVSSEESFDTDQERIEHVTGCMKTLAEDLGITIFVVEQ